VPWASAAKSLNAVRGCFGASKGDPKKKAKCRKMAHEARLWRGKGKAKKGRRMARRSKRMVKR